ncbi:hypothetical protein SAMN02745206_01034 [Desulfacinum infernum DSM 9756]|uniref:Uncharacterized protein n=1 Tax=Desulfacinum infernum DSM 9756 TaxID=1121391 RepID=A0A1M4XB61_9BACT|nr:hypothetical protein SAMN02745206_01034 [Desulfacinum infernum DSM 9756]
MLGVTSFFVAQPFRAAEERRASDGASAIARHFMGLRWPFPAGLKPRGYKGNRNLRHLEPESHCRASSLELVRKRLICAVQRPFVIPAEAGI